MTGRFKTGIHRPVHNRPDNPSFEVTQFEQLLASIERYDYPLHFVTTRYSAINQYQTECRARIWRLMIPTS